MIDYDIQISEEQKIIIVTVTGDIDATSYKNISNEVAKIYNENCYNVLYNLFNTNLNLSFEEVTKVPREIEQKRTTNAHCVCIAGFVNERDYSEWKFIEILNFGMGYKTKVFLDKQEALNWLTSCSNV